MKKTKGVTYEKFRELMLALPEVVEGSSYGTPGFKVKGKFLARLKEDGVTVVLRMDFPLRASLMEGAPETFYITDHYAAYPAVLVRLAQIGAEDLRYLLEETWRFCAPRRLVAAFDQTPKKDGA
jgi:hypothetical protein